MKTKLTQYQARLLCALALAMGASISFAATFSDANWIGMGGFPGADGSVNAAGADGSGNLYICGAFTIVGNAPASHVAKWNGSSWSALGSGIGMNSRVPSLSALAVSGNDVYVGGFFDVAGGNPANFVAKWNGSTWTNLGSGTDGYVYALAVSGTDLYAAGSFATAGGTTANNIAKWDGNSWTALGSGISSDTYTYVYALAVSGSDVYAAGYFTMADGSPASGIAKWDGTSWSALGPGVSGGEVYALAVSGNDVYAGGYFTMAGGNPANYIARWDGSSWSALGLGMDNSVNALAISGSDVYAGGHFTTADGSAANYVAKWNGSSWSTLGSGVDGPAQYPYPSVAALAVSGGNVYAGGVFTKAGGSPASYIAKWDGNSWSLPTSGTSALNGAVKAVAKSGSSLYAGGAFTIAGSSPANYVAKWDGSSWSSLGSGMSGGGGHVSSSILSPYVSALAILGSNVYAAGYFTNAGGVAANYIAKWDGGGWSALGSGIAGGLFIFGDFYPPYVSALTVSGSNLYAGGWFRTADGNQVNNVAKWNGSSWSALGSGIGSGVYGDYSKVYALAVSGNDLYVGGDFTTAGGNPANYIAKWDGSSWSALGSGIGSGVYGDYSKVYALAVSGNDLYVGGDFTTAAGNPANYVAKWNGSSWSTLGSGVSGPPQYSYPSVLALAVSGGNVYAGGVFTNADGSPANYIAKWDGTTWTMLGSGLNNTASVLAISGSDLYVGGAFTSAGGKASAYLARAIVNPPVLAMDPDGFGGYFLSFEGVPGSAYRLQRAPSLTGPWATSSPQTAPASGFLEFWDVFAPPGQGFYRTVGP